MKVGYRASLSELVERWARLKDAPQTACSLSMRVKHGETPCAEFLESLRLMRRAHICGWEFPKGRQVKAVYAIGPGEDVPEPTKRNGYDITVRRVQRKRKP